MCKELIADIIESVAKKDFFPIIILSVIAVACLITCACIITWWLYHIGFGH